MVRVEFEIEAVFLGECLETTAISDAYLGAYLVPLIAVSFVLLAAAIGAIVLARKD